MGGTFDLNPIQALAERVLEQGEPLELTADVRTLLRRSAREVAIPSQDAAKALRSLRTATALLRKIQRRIEEGEWRLATARHRASRREDAGDLDGAREQLEKVLAVEVVPLYRKQAKSQLAYIARIQKAAKTGRLDLTLPERSQLASLLYRRRLGKPLKLTEPVRSLLRRTAEEVALSDTETQAALVSPSGAEALLRKIMRRLRQGSIRLERALLRMVSLRDAGDLEGARQQLRELLAVEVVPRYREAAQENLEGLNEPPPAP